MTIIATTAISTTTDRAIRTRIEVVQRLLDEVPADVYVLPGGWFSAGEASGEKLIARLESYFVDAIRDQLLCFGVDAREAEPWSKDQFAVALASNGIVGLARKFHPAPGEKGVLDAAQDHLSRESQHTRIITHKDRTFYLAVCYDCFGIRQKHLTNPGVDAILTTAHEFHPLGMPNSGEAYFARHGIAGASKEWNVPTFASAAFIERPVPERWPTGISWTSGSLSTTKWTYKDNALRPEKSRLLTLRSGQCRVDTYAI